MTNSTTVQRVNVTMTLDIDAVAWVTEYGLEFSEVEHDAEELIVNTVVAHLSTLGLLARDQDQGRDRDRDPGEVCRCGIELDGGSWDGRCGTCADRHEAQRCATAEVQLPPAMFFGLDQLDDLYRVTNAGQPVAEEVVAYYAEVFPETIYFTSPTDLCAIPETTPTGIPIEDCTTCGRRHPITRKHCPRCGLAHIFPHPDERQPEDEQ